MEFKLSAQKRAPKEKLDRDHLPAVIYGRGLETHSLTLKKIEFEKIFDMAGESNLINLDFGEGVVKVLVKDVQRDVLKDTISHVDFYQVNMKEKVTASIPLHFIGESKVVREQGGMLNRELDEIEVECLPGDLVDHIDVDISVLESFDDVIKISNLKLPQGLEAVSETDDVVVTLIKPKEEEEEALAEAPVEEVAPAPEQVEPKKE